MQSIYILYIHPCLLLHKIIVYLMSNVSLKISQYQNFVFYFCGIYVHIIIKVGKFGFCFPVFIESLDFIPSMFLKTLGNNYVLSCEMLCQISCHKCIHIRSWTLGRIWKVGAFLFWKKLTERTKDWHLLYS